MKKQLALLSLIAGTVAGSLRSSGAVPAVSDVAMTQVSVMQNTSTRDRNSERYVLHKLKTIIVPEVSFRSPTTMIDAVDFFKIASQDYDDPSVPREKRGLNFILKLPANENLSEPNPKGVPRLPEMTLRRMSLFEVLKKVCIAAGMEFYIRGDVVVIAPLNEQIPNYMAEFRNDSKISHEDAKTLRKIQENKE